MKRKFVWGDVSTTAADYVSRWVKEDSPFGPDFRDTLSIALKMLGTVNPVTPRNDGRQYVPPHRRENGSACSNRGWRK